MVSLLTVIGVGFLLGMRHATDADHVIAATTIVTRQRSILRAGLIGILWGIGHTITILFVGAALFFLIWQFQLALASPWNWPWA